MHLAILFPVKSNLWATEISFSDVAPQIHVCGITPKRTVRFIFENFFNQGINSRAMLRLE